MLALMKVACSFEVQPLSLDTSQCTPVYIYLYPYEEVFITNVTLWNSYDLRCENVT